MTYQSRLPRFARDLLTSCPSAGAGVHNWLFRCARVMHPLYPDKLELLQLLRAACANCGRHIPEQEIRNAINNSVGCAWWPGQARVLASRAKWPPRNDEQVEAISRSGPALADLWEMSPVRIGEGESLVADIIDRLFEGDPLLCCGRTQFDFDTRPLKAWRRFLGALQFIVPNPMCAVRGETQDGRKSKHTLANTGPRRFLVVEFDRGAVDQHAALLAHLGTRAPLTLAVHSGGKSLHGWFFCAAQTDDCLMKFFRYAVSLGADPATWTRSQFVRLPDGQRENGKRQIVLFFNPTTMKAR